MFKQQFFFIINNAALPYTGFNPVIHMHGNTPSDLYYLSSIAHCPSTHTQIQAHTSDLHSALSSLCAVTFQVICVGVLDIDPLLTAAGLSVRYKAQLSNQYQVT